MPKGFETVTVKRKAKVDRLKQPSTAEESTHDLIGCIIWPAAVKEENGGWTQVDGWTIFVKPDADVIADDRVVVRGRTFNVQGTPGLYIKGRREKGILFTALAVS